MASDDSAALGTSDDDTKKDHPGGDAELDDKIDVLKAQIDAIEREAERLRTAEAAAAAAKADGAAATGTSGAVATTDRADTGAADELWRQRMETDQRSIYVGQVDYATTPEELAELLGAAGTVNRVTILCNRYTGHPKGFAYVEFEEQESVERSLRFNGTPFKGRLLKVAPKRTNYPWWMQQGKGGGGKGGSFRGRQAGGYSTRGRSWWTPPWFAGMYSPYYQPYYTPYWGRGRGFGVRRGRGRGKGSWY
eukprot:TRINITY_DN1923_c0_g1_i1.p1 TRINITY_DN1923_c0_g1~~TRINITY_DN1923_c0_g1_i1.p1  ORF type:complete len:279 (+),score=98.24 TRINITY_DN1923_c0_g1_i1:89-838(+)